MSRYVMPDTWHSLIETIMALVVPVKRPCGAISFSGTSMVMLGESFPTGTLLSPQNLVGALTVSRWGSPVMSSPPGWRQSMNFLLG